MGSIRQGRISQHEHSPNDALVAIHSNWDDHDTWGSCLEAHFQVCYTLSRRGRREDIPSEWEYRESPFGPESAEESILGCDLDPCSTRDLLKAGEVLARLARLIPE